MKREKEDMRIYEITLEVVKVDGYCAAGYKPGDKIIISGFYIDPSKNNSNICLHALIGISSLLSPFIHGVSAKTLGIGDKDDEGYIQCPDPGKPYTNGGRVVFRIKRGKRLE